MFSITISTTSISIVFNQSALFSMLILKSGSKNLSSKLSKSTSGLSLAKSTSFAALQGALNVFQGVAGAINVPGLQEGISALGIVLNAMLVRSRSCLYSGAR